MLAHLILFWPHRWHNIQRLAWVWYKYTKHVATNILEDHFVDGLKRLEVKLEQSPSVFDWMTFWTQYLRLVSLEFTMLFNLKLELCCSYRINFINTCPDLMYYRYICLGGLRKTLKTFSHDSNNNFQFRFRSREYSWPLSFLSWLHRNDHWVYRNK